MASSIQLRKCHATTLDGDKCKNITCHWVYCSVHLDKLYSLKVQQSQIANAGLGLFATKAIEKSEPIVIYTGKIYNEEVRGRYVAMGKKGVYIDSNHPKYSVARYTNSLTQSDRKNYNLKFNVRLMWKTKTQQLCLVATRSIKENDELFLDYGDEFDL